MFCMKCGQELPAQAKYCFNCGNRVEAEEESAKSIASQEGSLRESGTMKNNAISLLEFRQNAPSMTGFRDELISYRKSLSNSWDYNAYVGILLGVGGPKHGDAACMNYAIGQGDNGNNTKKTLEAKGLMPVFEKYKGKKIDEAVMLSDVEDEIIAVAPEYAQIRQRFHEIVMCNAGERIQQSEEKKPVEMLVKPEEIRIDHEQNSETVEKLDIQIHSKEEYESCRQCGRKLTSFDYYCPHCGKKRIPWIEGSTFSEQEESFALHKEYYWGNRADNDFTQYKEFLYFKHGDNIYEYNTKTKTGRKFLNVDDLGYSVCVGANRQGLYLWRMVKEQTEVMLYGYDGKIRGKYNLPKDAQGEYLYLYEDEVVYPVLSQNTLKIEVYSILQNRRSLTYDLSRFLTDIDEYSKRLLTEEIRENDGEMPIGTEFYDYKETNIKYVYANRSYIILGIEWVRNCNGYECIGDVDVCCDRRAFFSSEKEGVTSLYWSVLGNHYVDIDKIKGYDMLHNTIWYCDDRKALMSREMKHYELDKNGKKVAWYGKTDNEKVNRAFISALNAGSMNGKFYFDGEKAYYGASYLELFGMDADGRGGEWNRSGHGNADNFSVLGDYIYAGLDLINFYGNGDIHFFPAEGDLSSEDRWVVISKEMLKTWEKEEV